MAVLVLAAGPGHAQAPCEFVLGFSMLRQLLGAATVGDCLESQRSDPVSGNAEQRTTRGLLVWRKADNWTAFTDGYRTWINGPAGLQTRLNTERFSWEGSVEARPDLRSRALRPEDFGSDYAETTVERPAPTTIRIHLSSPAGPAAEQMLEYFDGSDAARQGLNQRVADHLADRSYPWFEVSPSGPAGARVLRGTASGGGVKALVAKGRYVASVGLFASYEWPGQPSAARAGDLLATWVARLPAE
jgi:hypothetical protein